MKKFVLPLAITIVGVVTVSALVMAKPKPTPRPPAGEPANVQVKVIESHPQTQRLAVTAQGTVTPKREISLVAQVSGQIVAVEDNFVDGGFFDQGEVLIQIDDRDYQAAYLTAQSRLAEAEQRLAQEAGQSRQAKREWRDLGDANANDLFMRKPQLTAATAAVASAKADLDIAQLNLERTRITVPFAGRIRENLVDLGQFVTAGTQLATVYDSSVVEVHIPLTEQQAALINLPFAQAVAIEDRPKVRVRGVVAGEQHEWQGVLARTAAFVDTDTRMYSAVIEVAEPFVQAMPLLPGLFVEAVIGGKELDNVVQLPRSALYKRSQLLTLNKAHEIQVVDVKVLRKAADFVWVQTDMPAQTLVSLEKQSLTPVGTVVDPQMEGRSFGEPAEPLVSLSSGTQPVATSLEK
ncbi:MAG TPA: efflux RND transporter periplasmic adaptor subunit [Cellvibrionaceae bacterium]